MDLVSVIIPVYNVAPYLEECVQSVLSQSYSNLEIILVDDGSTDGSSEICDKLACTDDRIEVIHKENKGLSDARNVGLDSATGRFINFLDSDDWLDVTTIEKAVKRILEINGDLILWSYIKEFEHKSIDAGSILDTTIFREREALRLHRRIAGPIGQELRFPAKIDAFCSAWGKLYVGKIIRDHELRFVDTQVVGSEDILFNFNYFNFVSVAAYLDESLLHYRKYNPNSLTRHHGDTLFRRFLNLFEYMDDFIRSHNLGEDFKKGLNNRICISMLNIALSATSPNNEKGALQIIRDLNDYLRSEVYMNAYKKLDFSFLPPHWKVFYACCKNRYGVLVYVLAKLIRLMR